MKERITKINRTLFELETGIMLFTLFCQLFVFIIKDKGSYSIGLWMGAVIAGASAVHMWWTLDHFLDLPEKAAVRKISIHNTLRYLFIGLALGLICISEIANPLSAFLGIMGLKAAAYLQFITKKISIMIYGEEILPPLIEEPADEQDM